MCKIMIIFCLLISLITEDHVRNEVKRHYTYPRAPIHFQSTLMKTVQRFGAAPMDTRCSTVLTRLSDKKKN